jgi:hypothetical protein
MPSIQSKSRIPKKIKCVYRKRTPQWEAGSASCWQCINCGQWTANLPLYKNDICESKDRRKSTADRRHNNHSMQFLKEFNNV